MKPATKTSLFLIIKGVLLIPSLIFPKSAFADGMVIKPDPFSGRWDYLSESNQQAFINYEDGLQKMILSIGIEKEAENAVWIFPVPAEPNKVVIDVLTKFPQLYGEEITEKAKSNLLDIKLALYSTQIYPLPFISFMRQSLSVPTGGEGMPLLGMGPTKDIEQDVKVYEHLEKEGITTEIITAKTAQGLYNYLQEKNLKIEKGSIPVLDSYIGKEFTFVVSWISPSSSNNEISDNDIFRFLYDYFLVEPTKYPEFDEFMKAYESKNECLTSQGQFDRTYYSSEQKWSGRYDCVENPKNIDLKNDLYKEIRVNITFINYVKELKKTERSKPQTTTNVLPRYPLSYNRGVFVSFPIDKIYYPLVPTSVYGSKTIPITIRVMGFVTPKIFKELQNYTKTDYFIDDYFNIEPELKNFYEGATKNVKYTKIEINAPSKMLIDDLWIEKTAPLKTFPALFIARHPFLTGVLLLILASLLAGLLSAVIFFREARNKKGLIKFGLLSLSNCLSIIGFIIFTIFTKTKEVKKEDEDLLKELKRRGYSIWALRAKDVRKLGFVPLFSISFLIITWIIIKVVELSL